MKKRLRISDDFSLIKNADILYLATDPDREGEAISWHIIEELKPKIPVKRLVFHEITKTAIIESFNNPQKIDMDLVNGYKARRVMDRIVGFETSAPLSSAIRVGGRATGRVQGPSLLIVHQREDEIKAHKALEFWNIKLDLANEKKQSIVVQLKGNESKKDYYVFDVKKDKQIPIPDISTATAIEEKLSKSTFKVKAIDKKQFSTKQSP